MTLRLVYCSDHPPQQLTPPSRADDVRDDLRFARRAVARNFQDAGAQKFSRVSTQDCCDFLRGALVDFTAKEVAALAGGISVAAAENLKAGVNGANMATLATVCLNSVLIRERWFAFCGGGIERSPELIASVARIVTEFSTPRTRADAASEIASCRRIRPAT